MNSFQFDLCTNFEQQQRANNNKNNKRRILSKVNKVCKNVKTKATFDFGYLAFEVLVRWVRFRCVHVLGSA